MTESNSFDVIIIGGSYAGLSASLALGRSLKKVLVIDAGNPCNRQTPHSHNFLTRDGETPGEISAIARKQVEKYDTVTFYDGQAEVGKKVSNGFEIITDSKEAFFGKKLIFATGIHDEIPDTPGFKECWGISVIHCPYCHGYEFRGKATGIFTNGDKAFHLASLVNNLTDTLYLLTPGNPEFSQDQLSKLNTHNIQIIDTPISQIDHQSGHMKQILFSNGSSLHLEAMYAAIPFTQHTSIPESLDCTLSEHGYLTVDPFQKTPIHGIYACGDNASPFRSISNAVLTGNVAGAMVNMELTNEQF